MAETEAAQIQAAKLGSQTAMESLFRQHVQSAVRLAYLITNDWSNAEDAVQDAFVQAFRCLQRFQDGCAFKPWFTRFVVNSAKQTRRKQAKHQPVAPSHRQQQPEPSAEELVLNKVDQHNLFGAINRLPENQRIPLVLKYFAELSEAETAAILQLPVSTVKSRLYTARQRLKELLSQEEGGPANGSPKAL